MIESMLDVAKWSTGIIFCLVVAAAPLLDELGVLTGEARGTRSMISFALFEASFSLLSAC